MVGSAGGVGAATVAVVSRPGPGLPGDVVGVTTLTDTLIGTKSFLDDSLRNPLTGQLGTIARHCRSTPFRFNVFEMNSKDVVSRQCRRNIIFDVLTSVGCG